MSQTQAAAATTPALINALGRNQADPVIRAELVSRGFPANVHARPLSITTRTEWLTDLNLDD